MKTTAFAKFMFAVLIAMSLIHPDGASAQEKLSYDTSQLSEKEAAFLVGLDSASEAKKRQVMEILAVRGQSKLINLAIRGGLATPDTKNKYTLLTASAEKGHLSTVKLLVEQGADIELKDGFNDTPLKAAARAGHQGIVEYLLLSGANPNSEGKGGATPLSSATYAGHLEVIKVLLNNGATIKSNDGRWTLIHYSAKYGHSELIDFYINKGVDINRRSAKGWTALTLAAEAGHTDAVAKLIANGADVNSPTNKKHSPMMLASKNGFFDIVRILIHEGGKINYEDEDKRSALWWAASMGQARIVELLLKARARADTAVSLFAKAGELQALETLIDAGMQLSTTNDEGRTGLHIAALYGHLDVVKLYLNRGLDIHTTDDKGYIALHRASGFGRTQVARYLLQQGSDADWEGQPNRWTPASIAARYGHLDILKMLHRSGANLNTVTNKGFSPLMLAAWGGKPLVVEYLLASNVNSKIQSNKLKTAIDIARSREHPAVVEMLSEL